MIERIYILESVDPVIFYGVNNSNMQLIKTLFPKLRIVARGNVMKVIGDEDESELFLKKIREVEKYCEEFNSLSEDVILDIIKGKGPTVVKQENLIIKRVVPENYEFGRIEIESPSGNPIRVYDLERTLCDILRGSGSDVQIVGEAMKRYAASKGKNIHKLMQYADQLRVKPKVLRYMEVLL